MNVTDVHEGEPPDLALVRLLAVLAPTVWTPPTVKNENAAVGLSRSLLNFASGGLPVSAPSRLFYATSATAPSGGASASKAPTR